MTAIADKLVSQSGAKAPGTLVDGASGRGISRSVAIFMKTKTNDDTDEMVGIYIPGRSEEIQMDE
jgi:hypothetical protein